MGNVKGNESTGHISDTETHPVNMAAGTVVHLGFVLCAITCAGILSNLLLLVWKLLKKRTSKEPILHTYTHILIHTVYILCGLGIILLFMFQVLQNADFLCKAGGFFVLFSAQFCLWAWVLFTGHVLLQQTRKPKPLTESTTKRRRTIYILIVVAKTVVLLALSFLPYIDIHYFDTKSKYYYMCTPIRLPGEMGWAYSTLIIVLSWTALITSAILTMLAVVKFRKLSGSFSKKSPHHQAVQAYSDYFAIYNRRSLIACCASVSANLVGWGTVLLIFSVSYFSGGAPHKQTIQWALGYSIAVILLVHAVLRLVLGSVWFLGAGGNSRSSSEESVFCCKYLEKKNPAKLDKLERLAAQQEGVSYYSVEWTEPDGYLANGIMKVFSPISQHKFRNEVRTLSKLFQEGYHHNLARYMWVAPSHKVSNFLRGYLSRELVCKEYSITCRQQYPSGTLQQFLAERISSLTDVGLHKITLDIAAGLEFLQRCRIVHNGLTTSAVYMASVSEKIGLRAVIGDFEKSYEVPPLPGECDIRTFAQNLKSYPLTSVSSQVDKLHKEWFSVDIRAFSLVVLEMLVSMSEYNQKTNRKTIERATTTIAPPAASSVRTQQKDMAGSSNTLTTEVVLEGRPPLPPRVKQCTCSKRVTDLRVNVGRSISLPLEQTPDLLAGRQGSLFKPISSDQVDGHDCENQNSPRNRQLNASQSSTELGANSLDHLYKLAKQPKKKKVPTATLR